MILEIVHVVILLALLACGLVVAWYAHKIHASQVRGLVFLDAQDIDHRRSRSDAGKIRDAWHKEVGNWLRDTRAILGKVYSIAAESSPHERDTHLMPPPIAGPAVSAPSPPVDIEAPEGERLSDSDAETRCMDKDLVLAALAVAGDPPPVPETTPRPCTSPASRQRPRPRSVEAKNVCGECVGGFVAVGNGGIGKCRACEGSGLIHAS